MKSRVAALQATAAAQGVRIERAIFCWSARGWIAWYSASMSTPARPSPPDLWSRRSSRAGEESLRYLWNNHFACRGG